VRSAAANDPLTESRRAYMRYQGQGYEIAVAVPSGALIGDDSEVLRRAFDEEYQRLYQRTIPGLDIEILSWTLTLSAPRQPVVADAEPLISQSVATDRRVALFDATLGEIVQAGSFLRDDLEPGDSVEGPAVVIEDQTTTVIPTEFVATVTGKRYLVLNRRETLS
jgi:N-methylhydantoinase A